MEKSHWGLLVILLLVIAGIFVFELMKKDEVTNNARGSIPFNENNNNYGLINLRPCGALFDINQTLKPKSEVKK